MRVIAAATLGLALAIAGCTKPTQEKTSADLKAAAGEVGDAAKQVAATPELKAVGSDIKQGAAEAADKTKEAAGKAGEKLKAGAEKAGAEIKEGAKTVGAKTDTALNQANEDAKK